MDAALSSERAASDVESACSAKDSQRRVSLTMTLPPPPPPPPPPPSEGASGPSVAPLCTSPRRSCRSSDGADLSTLLEESTRRRTSGFHGPDSLRRELSALGAETPKRSTRTSMCRGGTTRTAHAAIGSGQQAKPGSFDLTAKRAINRKRRSRRAKLMLLLDERTSSRPALVLHVTLWALIITSVVVIVIQSSPRLSHSRTDALFWVDFALYAAAPRAPELAPSPTSRSDQIRPLCSALLCVRPNTPPLTRSLAPRPCRNDLVNTATSASHSSSPSASARRPTSTSSCQTRSCTRTCWRSSRSSSSS